MRQRETVGFCCCRFVAGALACFSATATAQEGVLGMGGVSGIVRDSLGLAIIGTQITIRGSQIVAETDDSGRFELAKIRPGMLSLRFRRFGYQPDTVDLLILAGKTIPLEVKLVRSSVSLTPVVITARVDRTGWREGFYHRREVGAGHYFTAADIEKRNPRLMSDMFRTLPGVAVGASRGMIRNQFRFRGKSCAPLTWLDGAPLGAGEFDIDLITPFSVAAVEVYTGQIVPPKFATALGPRGCGVVVIWSKEGERRVRRPSQITASAASEIARLIDGRQIFTAAQVDISARQDSARPIRPTYPDALYEAQVTGSVMVEFIVTASGEVDPDRISIVYATHPGFVEAVKLALEDAVYVPAMRGGFPVYQVVQHEFRFVPDAAGRRRG